MAFLFLINSNKALSKDFNILTFNVQMRPFIDFNHYKATRLSPKFNQYDIVTVQESFSRKNILLKDAKHPYQAHLTDKRHCFSFVDSGLSTLAKFPIIFEAKEVYRAYAGFSDSLASKGILLTRFSIDGLILDVYNTHMQAGDTDRENKARREQALQVVEFVNKHSLPEHSVLIVGDFNMSPLRTDRKFDEYKPKHYSHDRDMIQRTSSFKLIMDGLLLTDIHDSLMSDRPDEIERMLFRSGCAHDFKPQKIYHPTEFIDEHKIPLSDGRPVVTNFSLTEGENRCG